MKLCGYVGKIVYVDLTTGRVRKENLDITLAKNFIGDFGIDAKLAYDLIKPGTAPFSPENVIIIGASPLAGTSIPSASRCHTFTKLPYSNTIAQGGGSMGFGSKLKYAGFDHLVITGRAEKPVYLTLLDGEVKICDANRLWGKDIFQTTDELWKNHGMKCSVLSIGQAGENLVMISLALIDKMGAVGRNGLASVMGSKNLKAIVVGGKKGVRVADREKLDGVIAPVLERMLTWPHRPEFLYLSHQMADFDNIHRLMALRNNFREKSDLATDRELYGPKVYLEDVKKYRAACPSCAIACRDVLEINKGEYKGLRTYAHGLVGRVMSIGLRMGVEPLDKVVKCLDTLQRYGIDEKSFGGVMELAIDLFDRGIITKSDTDGLALQRGFDTIMKWGEKVAFREGFGDVLADGDAGIIRRFGEQCRPFAVSFKGVDSHLDARPSKMGTLQFSMALEPRGHGKGGMFNIGKFDGNVSVEKYRGFCGFLSMTEEETDRIFDTPFKINIPRLTRHVEDYYSVASCLGTCIRVHIAQFYSIATLAQLYSATTGIEISARELKKAGERAWNVIRAANVREGFTRKDDKFPARWFEPMKDKDKEIRLMDYCETKFLTPEDMEGFLDDYYDERGWEVETGVPTKEKLVELGLEHVVEDLKKSEMLK